MPLVVIQRDAANDIDVSDLGAGETVRVGIAINAEAVGKRRTVPGVQVEIVLCNDVLVELLAVQFYPGTQCKVAAEVELGRVAAVDAIGPAVELERAIFLSETVRDGNGAGQDAVE